MKNYLFTFEWVSGSMNDNIIKWLKQNNIDWHYNHFFELVADVYGISQYLKFDYEKISGELYGVFIKAEV